MNITISATELGNYATRYSCLRCAWVRMHIKDLPYQAFPAIFSSIDSFTKNVIATHFEKYSSLPEWLGDIGNVTENIKPPNWRKFHRTDEATGITVRGEADAIFRLADGSYVIADYKTSRYNPDRKSTLLSYQMQLNAYAWISESYGYKPINHLYLIFMEPESQKEYASSNFSVSQTGIALGFKSNIIEVERRPEKLIPTALSKVHSVSKMKTPPDSRNRCRDCLKLDKMIVKMTYGISNDKN
ncbi:MAG: hypothetical protein CL739_06880 [Chloroflexi bacterium]|nr:hypothetical protein [Chloroflexota bacterium]